MSKFTRIPKAPERAEPEVDLGALEAFAAGAKTRHGAEGEEPPGRHSIRMRSRVITSASGSMITI